MAETTDQKSLANIDRKTLLAYAMLVIAMACWSGNWVVGRAVHVEVPPWGLTFWRWATAFIILLPICWRSFLRDWPYLRREWKLLIMLALTGTVLQQALVYVGLQSTEAINAVLLNAVGPAIMVITSWVLLRVVITKRQGFGMLIAFLGALVIVTRGDLELLQNLQLNRGDMWILVAIWFWCLYSIWLRRLPPEIGIRSLLLAITMIGLMVLGPAHLIEIAVDRPMPFTKNSILSILFVATGPSVLAFFCWNIAIARVGANTAGFFFFLMPVLGTIFAVIFLGETLFSYHFTGIAVVLAGIYFTTSRRPRRTAD